MSVIVKVGSRAKRARQTDTPIADLRPLGRHWRRRFLASLAETSNVRLACETAMVHHSTVYYLRRRDPDFAAKWAEALAEGYDNLEMELLHRLRTGSGKDDPKFDHAIAFRVLQQHRDAVMREKARRASVDVAVVRVSIARKVAEMRALILAERIAGLRSPSQWEPVDDVVD